MSYSKADLIEQTLAEVYALASGQTPNADDSARVEKRVDATLAALAKTNAYYIPDSDDIDDSIFNALVEYMAQVCRTSFNLPRDKQAELLAENELRRLARMGTGTGGPLRVDCALIPNRRRFYYGTSD